MGITPRIGALRCVDWVAPAAPWDGGLMFVFDGATLTAEQIAAIRLQPEELDRYELMPASALNDVLVPRLARRVEACLRLRGSGAGIYLEEGRSVDGCPG